MLTFYLYSASAGYIIHARRWLPNRSDNLHWRYHVERMVHSRTWRQWLKLTKLSFSSLLESRACKCNQNAASKEKAAEYEKGKFWVWSIKSRLWYTNTRSANHQNLMCLYQNRFRFWKTSSPISHSPDPYCGFQKSLKYSTLLRRVMDWKQRIYNGVVFNTSLFLAL